jgi:hypothetical protein
VGEMNVWSVGQTAMLCARALPLGWAVSTRRVHQGEPTMDGADDNPRIRGWLSPRR